MNIALKAAAGSLLGLATAGIALAATPAQAAPTIPSTVTIQAEGTDLFGNVSSTNSSCEPNRAVIVYKVVGTRGGGDDIRFAMDTSDDDGDWNTGNTGTAGKFYAKVKKTTFCKADFSPTITAHR
ncbi:hypothetical protein F0U44_09605 [Nocardioides humilatus]|uniref:Uncharacterized protein n=1 Tax=Nocardioides humilatus TaxID=2607660 RepID=A0A5B1LEV0_9ACTN|nr:hypothetical protein [Nocardioides humilatus]KAA1418738.1 hypothetical protein F0U44_09605 [Nocardioides humilatus]